MKAVKVLEAYFESRFFFDGFGNLTFDDFSPENFPKTCRRLNGQNPGSIATIFGRYTITEVPEDAYPYSNYVWYRADENGFLKFFK